MFGQSQNFKQTWNAILILVVIVFVDQLSKIFLKNLILQSGARSYLGGVLRIEYSENTGAFLSFGAHWSKEMRVLVFLIISTAFVVGALFYVYKQKNLDKLSGVGWMALLGGGIGNLIDRGFRGYVADFFIIDLGVVSTGVFNIADMAILFGTFVLTIQSFTGARKKRI